MAASANEDGLTKHRAKRKRVARMKKVIVATIALWMVISIVVLTVLAIEVVNLHRQINILAEEIASTKVEQNQVMETIVEKDYETIYTVADYSYNLAEEGDIPCVYLTFDDGPSKNSEEILNILDDYGVKATFFCVGTDDEELMPIYKRIVDEGHTLGMHSYSHKYSEIYASKASFVNDFEKIQNLIYDCTGYDSMYYRFPGGSSNRVSNTEMGVFIDYLNQENVVYFDWNVSSGDATAQAFSADELVENVMSDVVKYKSSVVLMHDAANKTATVEALPKLIEELQGIGAVILPISKDTTVIQHISATE